MTTRLLHETPDILQAACLRSADLPIRTEDFMLYVALNMNLAAKLDFGVKTLRDHEQ